MSLQEQHRSVTRDRLLSAAVTVLTQKSLVEATMGEIAQAAGTTRVTLYAHYPGKAEIIRAIADRLNADAERMFTNLAAQSSWTRAVLRGWLESLAAHYEANSALIRVLFRVGTGMLPPDLVSAQERWVGHLIADRNRWAAVSPEEAHQRALLTVLNTESFFTTWIVHRREMHTADPLDLFHQMVCYLLAPALVD